MRRWLLCLLVAICGCDNGHSNPPPSAVAVDPPYPVVAGDVEAMVSDGHEIIAPPGSATAGSTWIEHVVTYTNKSNQPVWVGGYSVTSPFSGIETRATDAAEWHDYSLGYCGTGAREFEIAPNATYSFRASLPKKYMGEEFRVLIPYRTERAGKQWFQAASKAPRLGSPAAG